MRIPGFIRRDFALKSVSLVLAVCIYVDVSDISTAGEYTLPVRCHISSEGIRAVRITPEQFKVTVSKMPIKK